jgi:MarR family transcriptional regulator, organic hydroperoxide resistance regulator
MSDTRFLDKHWAYQLSHAAHAVSRGLVAALHARDLTVAQWRVLATLYDDAPCTMQQLARRTLYQQTTLTKLVARMEKQQWLSRSAAPLDAREKHVALTAAGQQLASTLVRKARAAETQALSTLTAAERKTLASLLDKLTSVQ